MNNKLTLFVLSLLTAIIYFTFNYYYITYDNFNEDAYILFRYADMFNKGYGITYYPNAEPIEGATDFLWLIFIILVSKLGFSIGVSAILLNAIGVFIITYIIGILIFYSTNKYKILFYPILLLWIFIYPLIAALGGFSVMFYCSFIIAILYILDKKENLYYLVPILSLLLGLLRPDGVILGIGLSLLGLYFTFKINLNPKKYVIYSIISIIIGVIYFIWRFNYFGELLPLPLYVKSSESIYINLQTNFKTLLNYKQFYLYFLYFLILLLFVNKKVKLKFILLFTPFFFLFFAFMFSKQSQNIGFRFQAPIIIFFIYSIISISLYDFKNKYVNTLTLLFFIILSSKVLNILVYYYRPSTSLTSNFVLEMSKNYLKGDENIVLTEAGRIAYYQLKNNKIIDLVGLNTKYTAKNNLDQNYMNNINIDILMFYCENNFNKSINPSIKYNRIKNKDYFLAQFDFKNIEELNKINSLNKITNSTNQSLIYLYNNWEDFEIYIINFDDKSKFEYVYAFKKRLEKGIRIEDIMSKVANEKRKNYFELEVLRNEIN